jgi:hypothetical protein
VGTARFLAHDLEEDEEDIKLELYIWALGLEWQQHYQELLTSREVLWKVIGYRGIVSRACCEKVCTEEFLFSSGTTAPSGPGPPHYRGFMITLRHITFGRTPLDK